MPRAPSHTRNPSKFFGQRTKINTLQLAIGQLFKGPRWLRDKTENYHNWAKFNKLSYMRNLKSNYENFTQHMRPEKDIPHGDKFFSLLSKEPDDYMPMTENIYDDGRNYFCSSQTLVVDLIPFLLHTVDTRISTEAIVSGVVSVSKNARTVDDFIANLREWCWMERMEAIGSRVVVQHLRQLCTVIQSQEQARDIRRRLTVERGLLRQANGDRFYALPNTYNEYI